jgi:hypothetical protein
MPGLMRDNTSVPKRHLHFTILVSPVFLCDHQPPVGDVHPAPNCSSLRCSFPSNQRSGQKRVLSNSRHLRLLHLESSSLTECPLETSLTILYKFDLGVLGLGNSVRSLAGSRCQRNSGPVWRTANLRTSLKHHPMTTTPARPQPERPYLRP